MKKIIALLLALLLALAMLPALGEEGVQETSAPEHPVLPEGHPVLLPPRRAARNATGDAATISTVNAPVLGQQASWRFVPGEDFLPPYKFSVAEEPSVYGEDSRYIYVIYTQSFNVDDLITYTFREPGTYYLCVNGQSASGTNRQVWADSIIVTARDGVETVSSRVKEIVAECRSSLGTGAGEYATAVWLHDWVTGHCYYDLNYQNYGPDSILFRGTGVCDSYSKLYLLLLREAGITAQRMVNEGHAWNAVFLDGAWCQVDPTWDDPAGDNVPVSGSENHDYFGLDDEMMQLDHPYNYETVSPGCSTLANYYPYRSGEYRVWLYLVWDTIAQRFREGATSFDVDTQGTIVSELHGDGSYSFYSSSFAAEYCRLHLLWSARLLSMDPWENQNGIPMRASFTYDTASYLLHCELADPVADLDAALVLPDGVRIIDEYAFYDDDAIVSVKIPDGCQSIGSMAFADCDGLEWILLPDSLQTIADDAFDDDLSGVTFFCSPDSAAATYAASHGATVVSP